MKREEEGVHLPLEGRDGVFWEWLVGTGVRKNVRYFGIIACLVHHYSGAAFVSWKDHQTIV